MIEGIYAQLIGGRMDQHRRVFAVEYSVGRDLTPADVDAMIVTIDKWWVQCCVLVLGRSTHSHALTHSLTHTHTHTHSLTQALAVRECAGCAVE